MRLQGFTRTGWAGAAAVAVGCSGSHTETTKGSPVHGEAQVGEVHAQLNVGTESIGQLGWTVTPPSAVAAMVDAALSGTVPVQASGVAEWTFGGLPAARGYELTVAATTRDGEYVCASSTTFDIAAEAVSQATMTLACRSVAIQTDAGSVTLDLSTTVLVACTGVTSVSASPVGDSDLCQGATGVLWTDTMRLVATAIDSLGNTSDQYIDYAWTVSPDIGTFDDPTSSTPVFTCSGDVANGLPAEVTVTTSAPGSPTCGQAAVYSFAVNCLPPPCAAGLFACDCHICTDLRGDSANCGNCGIACPSGSACSQGVCLGGEAGADGE